MSENSARKTTRRPAPKPVGEDPVKQGAWAAVGVVLVAVLGLAALLVSPATLSGGMGAATGTPEANGGAIQETATVPAPATGEVTNVHVSVDGMTFMPNIIEVPAGNTLQVTFENSGDQRHDLLFENGAVIEPLPPGATEEVEVGPITSNMEGWCTLPGHRQMGMELTVVAVGAGEEGTTALDETPAANSADHSAHQTSTGPINMSALMEEAKKHDPYPAELEPVKDTAEPEIGRAHV